MGKLHLWLGLASGLVVLVVTITGSLLVFEKEIDEAVNHDFYFVQPQAQRVSLDEMLNNVAALHPGFTVTRMTLETDAPERSVLFLSKKGKALQYTAVNPYTGKVIRSVNYNKRFYTVVLQLHRTLCMNETGKVITGISCLIFLIMIGTGLVLWWPRRWRGLKQRLKVKWPASRKRLNWDLHAVGGFYLHLVMFAIAFTGLTWAYKWFNDGIFIVFDGKPYKKMEAPANQVQQPVAVGFYEQLYREANRQLPYKGELRFVLPEHDSLAIGVFKENYEASVSNVVDILYFEKGTGRLLKDHLYRNASTGWKVRRLMYPIHTGQIYGWPTRIIAFIACLVAASLPITGLYIWLGRKKKSARAGKKEPLPVSGKIPQPAVVV
jgi:Uncharacterized iron-regulated membrane protein